MGKSSELCSPGAVMTLFVTINHQLPQENTMRLPVPTVEEDIDNEDDQESW
jgi:hypothetical protein